MKASELRDKTVKELREELIALLKERFNLRIQKGMGEPPKAYLFERVKENIARVKTVLKEKGFQV
jgi:large subunit ribosomal protein L29